MGNSNFQQLAAALHTLAHFCSSHSLSSPWRIYRSHSHNSYARSIFESPSHSQSNNNNNKKIIKQQEINQICLSLDYSTTMNYQFGRNLLAAQSGFSHAPPNWPFIILTDAKNHFPLFLSSHKVKLFKSFE